MADISITAANVAPSTGAQIQTATAGVSITAGQSIYLDATAASTAKLAIATGTAAQANSVGIALNNAATGQPVNYTNGGIVTIGGTVVATQVYVVSPNNAGGIAPLSDLASTNYLTILGFGGSTSTLQMALKASGVTK